VIAFGQRYALHRLILDRAPFFTTALSEPWLESTSKEVTLHPEDIDSNITQASFELALKCLYGCDISEEEESEAVGLFATGCWLEMAGLVDTSVDAILRNMSPNNLAPLIRLVTTNYYGRAGERILSSAKSMLCRDGWEMPIRYWDGIPGNTVREIVGGDGFFVDGEWSRWVLAKRILDRRLRQTAVEAGLIPPGRKSQGGAPPALRVAAVRFNVAFHQSAASAEHHGSESHDIWTSLYASSEVEPLLVLLDEGIHYIHLGFEQLQYIRQARDVLGLPVMPEKVVTNALWMQMELRQKVLNADDSDMELGLSKPVQEPSQVKTTNKSKGKEKIGEEMVAHANEDADDVNWNSPAIPRKFWIPSADCNIVMGGNSEPVVTTSTSFNRHATRLSASLQPEEMFWASDFASSPSKMFTQETLGRTNAPARPGSASGSNAGQPRPVAFTHFPPFRFAAEFPNPRLLKEKKRVYSRTVFYAGSLWNIYIQKVRSSKNAQLGVYLHRAKERDTEEVIAGTAGLAQGTVDERIGLLEREMILRSERRDRRRGHNNHSADHATLLGGEEETSGSGGEPDSTLVATGSLNPLFGEIPRRNHRKPPRISGQSTSLKALSSPDATGSAPSSMQLDAAAAQSLFALPPSSSDSDDTEPELPNPSAVLAATRGKHSRGSAAAAAAASGNTAAVPSTIPPYVDARPTIKTYFKIYSPSKGGRLLSVYESAPDRFNFSQSWGWKSSTLMLDEGFLGNGSGAGGAGGGAGAGGAATEGETDEGVGGAASAGTAKGKRDGKLRFMVVIGNL
jgi:hypothetical protein